MDFYGLCCWYNRVASAEVIAECQSYIITGSDDFPGLGNWLMFIAILDKCPRPVYQCNWLK